MPAKHIASISLGLVFMYMRVDGSGAKFYKFSSLVHLHCRGVHGPILFELLRASDVCVRTCNKPSPEVDIRCLLSASAGVSPTGFTDSRLKE